VVAFVGQFVWIVALGIMMLAGVKVGWVYWIGLMVIWLILGWAGPRREKLLGGPDDLDRPGGPYDRLHHRVK